MQWSLTFTLDCASLSCLSITVAGALVLSLVLVARPHLFSPFINPNRNGSLLSLFPYNDLRLRHLLFGAPLIYIMMFIFIRLLLICLSFVSALPCSPIESSFIPFDDLKSFLSATFGRLHTRQYPHALDLGNGVSRFTIPYAQPPIGALRFANPQPPKGLNGYNISNTPPSCYQPSGDSRGGNAASEDCLYAT